MKHLSWLAGLLVSLVLTTTAPAAEPWPFFAFDNGVGRGAWSIEEQAKVLKEIGYAGIGYTGCNDLEQRFKVFEAAGLKIFSLYVGAKVGPGGPTIDPSLPQAITWLKGHDTMLWLTVQGKGDRAEDQAVAVVRQVADLAAASNLKVALYPHTAFYVEKVEDAVRIARKADRKNVGVTFNLCHFLKTDKIENLEKVLREAAPYLMLASVSGADRDGKDWKTLIQPLDKGTFDVLPLLKVLKSVGYRGPVGLQCYQVPGDQKDNLQRSLGAWKKLVSQIGS